MIISQILNNNVAIVKKGAMTKHAEMRSLSIQRGLLLGARSGI